MIPGSMNRRARVEIERESEIVCTPFFITATSLSGDLPVDTGHLRTNGLFQ
jgi:hypothetical protein